jgi:hypothetical protein
MSSSFITFNEYGFWAKDGFVESFQLLLFNEIQLQYQDSQLWLTNYKTELALQSLPLIYGGTSMQFDEILIDEKRKDVLVRLLDSIIFKIETNPDYLTGNYLNLQRKIVRQYLVDKKEFDWHEKEIERQLRDGAFGEQLPIEKYQRGFDLLRKLVLGQLTFKADSEITYWLD